MISAIRNSPYGNIAVTYVEWASNTAVVVDWMVIDGPESAQAFADALVGPPRQAFGPNAIGKALLAGMAQIEGNAITAPRKVIDFSGDSIRNSFDPPIEVARAAVLDAGITINALPILRPEDGRRAGFNLEEEYKSRIIGGFGAFGGGPCGGGAGWVSGVVSAEMVAVMSAPLPHRPLVPGIDVHDR